MKGTLITIGIIILNIYCNAQEATFRKNLDDKKQYANTTKSFSPENKTDSITVKTLRSSDGWGYDIYVNSKNYIHQEYIPAISGKKPFKSKNDAEKTAGIVKEKIKKNIIPPSMTVNELNKIGVNIE